MAKKVAILGGTGKMGRWFSQFLKDKGFDVAIHSRSQQRAAQAAYELDVNYLESIDEVWAMDMVIVSTTISSTPGVIQSVSKKMQSNAILFDIASVKGKIIDALKEAETLGVRVISVHPMFGPGAKSLKGKHIILIPISNDQALVDEILNLFEEAETHILPSGEAHDEMIALTLSLPHFLNVVFGMTLAGLDIKEINKFAGTTFMLQLMIAEAVFSEDPNLYYEIQSQNAAFSHVLNVFAEATREFASTIKRGDRERFVKYFKEVKSVLSKDPHFIDSYSRFYKAFEAIT